MAFNVFGFEISRAKEKKLNSPAIIPDSRSDGAVVIQDGPLGGGTNGYAYDFNLRYDNDKQLIEHYRKMAMDPYVDSAIDDIVNEAVVLDEEEQPIKMTLEGTDFSDSVKDKIEEEFKTILRLLNFNEEGIDLFRQWYVDGRQYVYMMIDENNKRDGIREIRVVDPRDIKKVKRKKTKIVNGYEVEDGVEEFYIFADTQLKSRGQALEVRADSIAYITSGQYDEDGNALSLLHKAIKAQNQLSMLEDAVVIYRISRAPERRVFYVDVGELPKERAEQYMRGIMEKHKNKMVYDSSTGSVTETSAHRSMLEDIWLPRRDGSRGTEVDTLAGGQTLGELDDVEYFRRKLYKAMNIPVSRLEQENTFNLGRASEITRDELKFHKFIIKLRRTFNKTFYKLLKTQLILKNIITEDDWIKNYQEIAFIYNDDTHFSELKDAEIMESRVRGLVEIDAFVGRYFSLEFVQKNILRMTEEEIEEEYKQIDKEKKEGRITEPEEDAGGFGGGRRF